MIKILVGISGSGKSTLAHNMWATSPHTTVVVNRDKTRELLFGYNEESVKEYYKRTDIRSLEKQVTLYQDSIIYNALTQGKDVIIDATNLNRKDIEHFVMFNTEVQYVVSEDSYDLNLCIERDNNRLRKVGKEIITKQYNKFKNIVNDLPKLEPITLNNDPKNKPIYAFDIDGTLALKGGRNAYDETKVLEDTTDEAVCNIFQILHNSGIELVVCSGRTEACLEDTKEWFRINLGYVPKIMMRKVGDQRADWIIKTEMWQDICKNKYIMTLIDDRNQIIYRARMLGLKVLQVENGMF